MVAGESVDAVNSILWTILGLVAYGIGSTVAAVIIGRMIHRGLYGGPERH